jgi:hypothetical protein
MIDRRGSPFSKLQHKVIPISRVRIVRHVSKLNQLHNGWHVEYLPAGKSRWWWNWQVYRREHNEETARLLADVLLSERSVTLTSYANTEVEL